MFRPRTLIWLMLLLLTAIGCKNDNNVLTSTTVQVVGYVTDQRTHRGIPSAFVSCVEFTDASTSSDSSGHFQLEITTGDSFRSGLKIFASDSGYKNDTVAVTAASGQRVNANLELINLGDISDTTNTGPSGPPATILFVSASDTSIGVRETGIPENAILTYEVRDNRGVAIDLTHRVVVHFSIEGGPGAGEYLGIDTAITNGNGRAQVSVISGIRPGTMQIMATVHDTIHARPVRITIHTGPPDSVHSSVGFQEINFPGIGWINRRDTVTALIGDRYSNPVPQGTQSYFSSDHGVIEPQGIADRDGLTSVLLISGSPFPILTRGWSSVHVQTVDWTGHRYTLNGTLLWTGEIDTSTFSITPTSFDILNDSAQTFYVHVADIYSHPLSSGTTLRVSTNFGDLSGDINVTFPDTWNNGWTNFSFVLSDPDTNVQVHATTVQVDINGRNGAIGGFVSGIIW